ncbi:MAG: ABC transporter permease [Bacteroides sp.]|nr:ABC transporter permease [Bacteroides sp.]
MYCYLTVTLKKGYDLTHVYRIQLGEYDTQHSYYDATAASDSMKSIHLSRITDAIEAYPGVEAWTVANGGSYPFSGGYSTTGIFRDSLQRYSLYYEFWDTGDYFGVFRMTKYERTVSAGEIPTWEKGQVYLTKDLVHKLFPEGGEVIGEYVHTKDTAQLFRIAGIVEPIQFRSIRQPIPVLFVPRQEWEVGTMPWNTQICFRLSAEVDHAAFTDQMKADMKKVARDNGNFFLMNMMPFSAIRKEMEHGTNNTLRLQAAYSIFFLLCAFLGIAGTFWLYSSARRSEIGLRMALGSSSAGIRQQFFTESWLLITLGWLVSLIVVIQKVCISGFAFPTEDGDPVYLQNQPVPHFIIVSLMVYLLLLGIAFPGTWFPAQRAAETHPAEALRDE